ncbi:MAG: NYN domain-containing protein [Sedimentisphaerales bacterium]|nr:NYN domain-containing protein [Sedimentisphaerales bacterium]
MPVIIDGYNLLWFIRESDEQFDSVTDAQLCQILGRYFRLTGKRGEIVFDGTGPRDKNIFKSITNLEISFSGLGTEADTIIERKITASTAPKRLIVVSTDRRLRDAARARKATAVKSELFWKKVQKQLARKRKTLEPAAKRHGLSETEADQWIKFFDLKQ